MIRLPAIIKKKIGPEEVYPVAFAISTLAGSSFGQIMDQFIKQDETGDLIETGMNVANHFLSAPIQGNSSLGKTTIPPGVVPVLVGAAEQKNIQVGPPMSGGARPKTKRPGLKPIILPPTETPQPGMRIPEPLLAQSGQGGLVTTYRPDVNSQPSGTYRSVELAKVGKERMINRFVEKPRTSTPIPEFKRGARDDELPLPNIGGGHRREWSLSWVKGEVRVFEWCNPICSPITAAARFHPCRCGLCPAKCDQCERDNGPPKGNGE